MTNSITFNEKDSRYERLVEGYTAYARTHQKGETLYIDYVFTPPELRGKGVAGGFMTDLMVLVRKNGWQVVPVCGFAAGWLRQHSEYDDLIQKD